MLKKNLLFFSLCLLFCGCSSIGSEPKEKIDEYFDVSGLLKSQLEILIKEKPFLAKTVNLDGEVEEQRLQPDSLQWVRELDLFFKSDINKPILSGAYNIRTEKNVTIYSPKEALTKSGVEELSVITNSDHVEKIEATYFDKNPIYSSYQHVWMSFESIDGLNKIKNYSISGSHKIVGKDTVSYTVNADVLTEKN